MRHGYHLEEPGDDWRRYSRGRRVFALLNGYHVKMEVRVTIEHGAAITVGTEVRAMQFQGTNRGTRIEIEQSDILRGFVSGCMEEVVDMAANTQSEAGRCDGDKPEN